MVVQLGHFGKEIKKSLEGFEIRCLRRMEIILTDRVRNEVLDTVKEERKIIHTTKEGELTRLVTSCVRIKG
jgi:hypothetical protein